MNIGINLEIFVNNFNNILGKYKKVTIFNRKKIINEINYNLNIDNINNIKKLLNSSNNIYILSKLDGNILNILKKILLNRINSEFNIINVNDENYDTKIMNNNIQIVINSNLKNVDLNINHKYDNKNINNISLMNAVNYIDEYVRNLEKRIKDPIGPQPILPSQEKAWIKNSYSINQITVPIGKQNTNLCNYLFSNIDDLSQTALIYFDKKYTFNDIKNMVDSISSNFLEKYNVKANDTIAICMPNTPEAIIAILAANNIGASVLPLHPLSKTSDIIESLNETKAKVLFISDNNCNQINDIINSTGVNKIVYSKIGDSMSRIYRFAYNLNKEIEKIKNKYSIVKLKIGNFILPKNYKLINNHSMKAITKMNYSNIINKFSELLINSGDFKSDIYYEKNATAFLLKTGGTTGTSKLTMLTNENAIANIEQLKYTIPSYKKKDVAAVIAPIFHGFGLIDSLLAAWTANLTINLHPRYDQKLFNKSVVKYNTSMILGPPTLFKAMINSEIYNKKKLEKLNNLICGSDKLDDNLRKQINDWKMEHSSPNPIFSGLGMTEATAAISFTGLNSLNNESVGYPLPGNDVKIVSLDDNSELGYDQPGELWISGPTIMKGYYNNIDETNTVLVNENGKIWLRTGDICKLSKNGEILFVDRKKGIIVVSGINVYRNQIEKVVNSLREVEMSAAVSISHQYKINVPKVYVVLKKGIIMDDNLKQEFLNYCNSKLDKYQKIYDIEQIDELPLTKLNKIDYNKLESYNKKVK